MLEKFNLLEKIFEKFSKEIIKIFSSNLDCDKIRVMEVTLNLSEKIYQDISIVAKKSKRKVIDLIVDVVQEKYSPKSLERPLTTLSDDEVLALANLQMPEKQSKRHSELLYKNQAGTLKPNEKQELDFFQQVYGIALARKTDGLYEAIQRNLIKSPDDLVNE